MACSKIRTPLEEFAEKEYDAYVYNLQKIKDTYSLQILELARKFHHGDEDKAKELTAALLNPKEDEDTIIDAAFNIVSSESEIEAKAEEFRNRFDALYLHLIVPFDKLHRDRRFESTDQLNRKFFQRVDIYEGEDMNIRAADIALRSFLTTYLRHYSEEETESHLGVNKVVRNEAEIQMEVSEFLANYGHMAFTLTILLTAHGSEDGDIFMGDKSKIPTVDFLQKLLTIIKQNEVEHGEIPITIILGHCFNHKGTGDFTSTNLNVSIITTAKEKGFNQRSVTFKKRENTHLDWTDKRRFEYTDVVTSYNEGFGEYATTHPFKRKEEMNIIHGNKDEEGISTGLESMDTDPPYVTEAIDTNEEDTSSYVDEKSDK